MNNSVHYSVDLVKRNIVLIMCYTTRVGIRGEEKVLKTEVLKHTGWPIGPVVSVVGEDRKMILHSLENSEEERGKNSNESRQLVLIFTLVGILLAIYGLIAIR